MEPKTYTTIDLRKQMGEILDRTRIAGEPAAITRKGKTLAYLVRPSGSSSTWPSARRPPAPTRVPPERAGP